MSYATVSIKVSIDHNESKKRNGCFVPYISILLLSKIDNKIIIESGNIPTKDEIHMSEEAVLNELFDLNFTTKQKQIISEIDA